MSNAEEKLSAEQSLSIITDMIRQAQGRVSGNSFYFILWGWTIMLANLGMYSLMQFTSYQYPYMVWLLVVPSWIITFIYALKQSQTSRGRTHLENIYMWLWIAMAVCMLPVCIFGYRLNWNINPIVLLMAGLPTFISGTMIRFKPLMWGGLSFWVAGVLCFLVPQQTQYLIGVFAMIFGYLIPGYRLKSIKES